MVEVIRSALTASAPRQSKLIEIEAAGQQALHRLRQQGEPALHLRFALRTRVGAGRSVPGPQEIEPNRLATPARNSERPLKARWGSKG